MVFIAIGALKAAKVAKKEYDKDKKRTQIIAPLDNSRRNEFDNAPASASPEWWGSEETAQNESKTVEHPSQASFGAWSRDALLTRIAQQEARDEEYDARFREQLSNSSASLPSTAVPSASHSPALALRQSATIPTEPAHSSSGSLKQFLPPPVSERTEHHKQAQSYSPSHVADAAQILQSNPARKPPRPESAPSAAEGSYEAALHSFSTRSKSVRASENSLVDGTKIGTATTEGDESVLLQNPSCSELVALHTRPEKKAVTVRGSFEEALQDGTAHGERFKPSSSASDAAYSDAAAQVSAFADTFDTRRRERIQSRATPLRNSASAASEEDCRHIAQQSAFPSTQSTKKLTRRLTGNTSASGSAGSAFARSGSMRRRHGVGHAAPNCAITPQAGARQNSFDASSRSTAGDQSGRTHGESSTTAASSFAARNEVNPASSIPSSATSCMSAVGSMKKRRSRRPNP